MSSPTAASGQSASASAPKSPEDSSKDNEKPPCVALLAGVSAKLRKELEPWLAGAKIVEVPLDLEKLAEPIDTQPYLVVCADPPEGLSLTELAQILRMNYLDTLIYLVADAKRGFNKKDLVKNGFTDLFLMPLDSAVMETSLKEAMAKFNSRARVFRSVKIVDLEPSSKLSFDTFVYLPLNGKHVMFSSSGDELSPSKAEKLSQSKINSIFVAKDQMQRFYDYTAERLRSIQGDKKISETERREKLQGAVRDLISGLFTDTSATTESGRVIVEDCQKIVSSYITRTDKGKWYQRLLAVQSDSKDSYSHASNVSTYAAMFSMALGIGQPETVALAGLLHDIGLARVPREIQEKDPSTWTPEERAEYQKHPEHSVAIVQERKLLVSGLVHRIILQHHEAYNGTGYPKGLTGSKICEEAQLLALADHFDYMTAVVAGKPRMSPTEALKKLRMEAANDPSKMVFHPDLLRKVLQLFQTEESKAAATS